MSMLLRRHYVNKNNSIGISSSGNTIAGATQKRVAPAPSLKGKKDTKPQKEEKSEYTEEKINAMTGTKLRKLAKENGVQNPEELTAGELKAILCELLCK